MSAADLPRWATLPEPDFIQRDPAAITAEMVAMYEQRTGKTLYPAQAERLLVDVIAYRETLVRIGIQEAAKQCLVRFARAPMLDYLGELVGVTRLPAQPARCTIRFSRTDSTAAVLIPAGTRIESGDGRIAFVTDNDSTLAAGQLAIDLLASSTETGEQANGWQPGQISTLLDDLGEDVTAANIDISQGGSEEEQDDRLRERIFLAPEAFSTAGSRLAYRFHAMSAHPRIIDVAVLGPKLTLSDGRLVSQNGIPPGSVRLYPLLDSGLPDAAMLALVNNTCSAEKLRPLCDEVQTLAPVARNYSISATLTLYATADRDTVLALARDAASRYATDRAAGLGRDVVPSQLVSTLSVPGVYEVTLAGLASRLTLAEHEWARCTGIVISAAPEAVNG